MKKAGRGIVIAADGRSAAEKVRVSPKATVVLQEAAEARLVGAIDWRSGGRLLCNFRVVQREILVAMRYTCRWTTCWQHSA
jgi:hypothetical protein